MELLNATKMQAGYTGGLNPDGRELLVVAVKGTFTLPESSEPATLAETQAPLIEADTFTGEPGFSAPVYECDYAPIKPSCDILFNGSAYAPGGRPTSRVTVAMQVGALSKSFDVVGDRVWQTSLLRRSSRPEPFTVMPISYDRAFGGVDNFHKDPAKHGTYVLNHAGRGFHQQIASDLLEGAPLPNTEESGRAIDDPRGNYKPMAFGPLGRAWQPRASLAGTYDQEWIDKVFPFLPADFDPRYYQASPADQQIVDPRGGETVVLRNLTPEGYTTFELPQVNIPVVFYLKHRDNVEMQAKLDTIVFEPDLYRFSMTWRATLPLRRNMFEVEQVLAGEMPRGWYRARELGKTYYPSLSAAVAGRNGGLA
jgi:hypothetical protein